MNPYDFCIYENSFASFLWRTEVNPNSIAVGVFVLLALTRIGLVVYCNLYVIVGPLKLYLSRGDLKPEIVLNHVRPRQVALDLNLKSALVKVCRSLAADFSIHSLNELKLD